MNLLEHCIVPEWPAPPGVKALQTTRKGGVSASPYDTLNLGELAAQRTGMAGAGAWHYRG